MRRTVVSIKGMKEATMISERTRIICIVLTIPCIIAVLVGNCRAEGEVERLCARSKARVQAMNHLGFRPAADISDLPQWQQIMLKSITPVQPRDYGSSYVGSTYSESASNVIINQNQNINRNNVTVIVERSDPYYYYYPVYRNDWSTRQHFYMYNQNTRR
jgi:hypothetical protein